MYIILAIILTVVWIWIGYEIYNAPTQDEDGNLIYRKKKSKKRKLFSYNWKAFYICKLFGHKWRISYIYGMRAHAKCDRCSFSKDDHIDNFV
jgi:hypothetical protein